MNKKMDAVKLIWRITYAHTIAYAIAGVLMMFFMNYDEIWAMEIMSFYRPIDDPILTIAIPLQIPRGVLIALFILPLRKAFFEENHGLWKLGLIVFGFAVISTIGAPWASYESYIYTLFPLSLQLKGYPEAVLYVSLFIGILHISQRFANKKVIDITAAIVLFLFSFLQILGFFSLNQ
jgi:hypothetical protein